MNMNLDTVEFFDGDKNIRLDRKFVEDAKRLIEQDGNPIEYLMKKGLPRETATLIVRAALQWLSEDVLALLRHR